MLKRELNLPKSHSIFLFGPRQTGKTTLVKSTFSPKKIKSYNLLLSSEFQRLFANLSLFREEVLGLNSEFSHVFVDEVQRIPDLLNEVHSLIEEGVPQKFILTGSSARKLKRGRANLLAGRAWMLNLFPLTSHELGASFRLNQALSFGTLPLVYTNPDPAARQEDLRSYVEVYLKEEIEAEALSRNLGGFIRFLNVAAQANGEQLNFSNVARDTGISAVTAKEYFKILEDTLIGRFLLPFHQSERKRHKLSPKFYFFDTGVTRAIQKKLQIDVAPGSFEYGNLFETWILNEAFSISSYLKKDLQFSFLRTASNVEVDLIIECPDNKIFAVEIKSKPSPIPLDFGSGFEAVKKLVPKAKCYCVCTGRNPRLVNGYEILPYADFLAWLRQI